MIATFRVNLSNLFIHIPWDWGWLFFFFLNGNHTGVGLRKIHNLMENEICFLHIRATHLCMPPVLPFQMPPRLFFLFIYQLWSRHIRSGHRLIVHPTGSVGLQQSEGSTLPQPYFWWWHSSLNATSAERKEETAGSQPIVCFQQVLGSVSSFSTTNDVPSQAAACPSSLGQP